MSEEQICTCGGGYMRWSNDHDGWVCVDCGYLIDEGDPRFEGDDEEDSRFDDFDRLPGWRY